MFNKENLPEIPKSIKEQYTQWQGKNKNNIVENAHLLIQQELEKELQKELKDDK